ncbi:MAG TPA: hypothetical protein VFF81_09060 [Noviherbaspirillum sp.]|nr:hypothetical protein [Noviherbaspirillum sp.]
MGALQNDCSAGLKADEGHGGAITLIQRFGSAGNNEAVIVRSLKTAIKDSRLITPMASST